MLSQDIDETIRHLTAQGKPYVVATVVRTEPPTSAKAGDRAVIDEDGVLSGWCGGGCAVPAVTRNAADAICDGQTRLIRISRDLDGLDPGVLGYPMTCQSGGTLDIFLEPVLPAVQLVVIGKTAIARALARLGGEVGYEVIVAAPGADRDQFPSACRWLDDLDAVGALSPAPFAVIVATQGSGDARALQAALNAGAGYIGFIASRAKGARLKETLVKRGLDPAQVEAIDAPAGLDIGAATPVEVAVSLLAELVRRRRVGVMGEQAALPGNGDAPCCAS